MVLESEEERKKNKLFEKKKLFLEKKIYGGNQNCKDV